VSGGDVPSIGKKRVIGIVVLAIGLVLLGFAYHATNAPMEKNSDAVTGRYSNRTM
jgi:hypothetical protein